MARKTPVLLRRGPLSGRIQALTNYRHLTGDREGVLQVIGDGKHDVSADFDTLMLEALIPDSKSDIIAALDGAAKGMELSEAERQGIAEFRQRLVDIIERHNARLREADNG